MTRDVLVRKLSRLRGYLEALAPHEGRSAEDIAGDPYEIERLLELLVQVAVDVLSHELAEIGVVPDSYRKAFTLAGRHALLPSDLANSLADAAGLRNILVHLYEEIDYGIVAASVDRALRDFDRFLKVYAARLVESDPRPENGGMDGPSSAPGHGSHAS